MKERLGRELQARQSPHQGAAQKILNWLGAFEDPREEVKRRVENFKNHPLVRM